MSSLIDNKIQAHTTFYIDARLIPDVEDTTIKIVK